MCSRYDYNFFLYYFIPCPVDLRSWNHSMTFDGRVFLSKMRTAALILNGNWDYFLIGVQVLGLFLCTIALYFCYFHFQLFHYHVTGVYARLGHADAQHLLGDKLLHGKGVEKDEVRIPICYLCTFTKNVS